MPGSLGLVGQMETRKSSLSLKHCKLCVLEDAVAAMHRALALMIPMESAHQACPVWRCCHSLDAQASGFWGIWTDYIGFWNSVDWVSVIGGKPPHVAELLKHLKVARDGVLRSTHNIQTSFASIVCVLCNLISIRWGML
eukprot:1378374-Amphidinium_carterae.1